MRSLLFQANAKLVKIYQLILFRSPEIPSLSLKMAKGAKLTWYNVAICLLVVSGAFTYGFGLAVFTTSIGQPGFYLDFDLDRASRIT